MSRKAVALTLILSLLVSVLAGTLLIQNGGKTSIVHGETTSNNNIIIDGNPNATLTIQSPVNKAYNENNITVTFSIETDVPPQENFGGTLFALFLRHGVALDSNIASLEATVRRDYPTNVPTNFTHSGNSWIGNLTLTNLSQGVHNITVWIRADSYWISYSGYEWSIFSTVSFNIDSIPPNISIASPETKDYSISDIPLIFTVNKTYSQASYCLDGMENKTINGNVRLNGLSNGMHNVTVYATDEAGNVGASQTIAFTVTTFPTLTVAIVSAAVAVVVVAGLLVYFKKRKR